MSSAVSLVFGLSSLSACRLLEENAMIEYRNIPAEMAIIIGTLRTE